MACPPSFHADKCPYGFKVVVEGASAADPPRVICRPSSVDFATSGVRKAVTQASREALRVVDEKMERVRDAQRKAEEQRELKGTAGVIPLSVFVCVSVCLCACVSACVCVCVCVCVCIYAGMHTYLCI
jgi:hypothetical protein